MPTLGEELRRRREERTMTLGEISEATRIGTRFLKAIESDNFSILPGGIYTRNFIRAFAAEVGMDEEEAVAIYHQQATGQPASAVQQAPVERRAPQQPVIVEPRVRRPEPLTYRQTAPRTNWPTIIIGGGIALFVLLIVLAVVKKLDQSGSNAPTEPASGQQTQPASPPVTPQPETAKPAEPPPAPAGEALAVKVEATTGDSYIRYQIDEAKPISILLKQGQSQELPPAQNAIKLSYGNRLALKLLINNRQANFPADAPKFGSQVVISRDTLQTFFQ
jgi:cytoskeletal protein RodZ